MNSLHICTQPLSKHLRAVLSGRVALSIYVLALALIFPDLVLFVLVQALHLVWFVVHIGIAWVELGVEHLLEGSLGVSRHTAQIMTAWIGLAAFSAGLAWLGSRSLPKLRSLLAVWRQDTTERNQPESP